MVRLAIISAVVLTSLNHSGLAQGTPVETLEYYLNRYFSSEVDIDLDGLSEQLQSLTKNPIQINLADPVDLSRAFFINQDELQSILDYLLRFGPMSSIYELAAIDGISVDLATDLARFCVLTIDPKRDKQFSTEAIILSSTTMPFDSTVSYPLKLKASILSEWGNWRMSLLAEQDKGEAWRPGAPVHGFDHYNGNLLWRHPSGSFKAVAGSFRLDFGNGNLYYSGFNLSERSGAGKYRSPLRLNTGGLGTEAGYFRGLAIEWRSHGLTCIAGISSILRDGVIDTLNLKPVINYDVSGYHTTDPEMARRGALLESSVMVGLNHSSRNFSTGLLACYYSISDRNMKGKAALTSSSGYAEFRSRLASGRVELNHLAAEGILASAKLWLAFRSGATGFIRASYRSAGLNWTEDFFHGGGIDKLMSVYWGLELKPVRSWTLESGVGASWEESGWRAVEPPLASTQVALYFDGRVQGQLRMSVPPLDLKKTRITIQVRGKNPSGSNLGYTLSAMPGGTLVAIAYYSDPDRPWRVICRFQLWDTDGSTNMLYAWSNDVPGLGRMASFNASGQSLSLSIINRKRSSIALGFGIRTQNTLLINPKSRSIAANRPEFELSLRTKLST